MKDIYCVVGGTLLFSSIIMAVMKSDTYIFEYFNSLLNTEQKRKYQKIIKERTCIYLSGMILGLLCGFFYLYKFPEDSYPMCKFVAITYIIHLGFYYFFPKSPLMLYSLTTVEQKDAWADIYTIMKKRWQISLVCGFIGTLLLGKFVI